MTLIPEIEERNENVLVNLILKGYITYKKYQIALLIM